MAYSDPTFEQRRAAIIKGSGSPAPVSSGGYKAPSTGGFIDQSFEARRKQIYSTPAPSAPAPVISSTPTPAPATPNFLQTAQTGIGSALHGIGDFFSGVEKKIAGIFTPKGGKPEPITPYNQQPIKVPELSESQIKSISSLKVGDKIPGFDLSEPKTSGASAQLTPEAKQQAQNTLDAIFEKGNQFFGPIGSAIQRQASEIYNNPIENLTGPTGSLLKTIEKQNPELYKKIQENPIYKVEESSLQGVIQGALRVYANWNPNVESFLDKELKSVGTKGDAEIVGNTVGNIVGTIGSFVLGGEVASALKLGKVALPATFAVLGQTQLPSSTPIEARARNLIVDTVTGTVLEYIKPLANLQKLGTFEKGVEYSKQLAKSMTALSAQTYLDARSVGATNEQALEMVKDSALILLGIHGVMIAGKAGQYAVSSKFKEGSAVFTPEQARATVVGTNLENTDLGKAIIKFAMDAEVQGKNLQIDMTAAKKSKIAGVLNLKTPNGITITNMELVDATQQPKLGSATTETAGPKAPGTVPVEPAGGKPVTDIVAQDAELKKVSTNLMKNNPGLSQTEAEAMAKDVIANRKPEPEKPPVPPEMKAIIRVPEEYRGPVEKEAFTKITEDPVKAVEEYEKAFGNEVSPDLALTQFKGYEGSNASDLSRASGLMKSLVYDDLIRTQKGEKNNTVLFTAGGPGSGKTSAVQGSIDPTGEHPVKERYPIIVDTTFSNNSAPKDIEKALKNGYKVDIAYVFRDPVAAWEQGALPRIGEEGRVVSEGYFIKAHMDAQKNIIKAYNKYKDNPNVDFIFVENTADRSTPEISFDKIKEYLYNKGEVASAITRATNEAYETGKITKKQYEAATSDRAGLGAGFASELSSKSRKQVQAGEKIQLQTETGEIILPQEQVFYRGGGQGSMPKDGTAQDVLTYEREELGNADVVQEPGVDLSQIPAKNLVWVTETPEQAAEYGTVSPVTLDHYSILARDGQGGLLINRRPSVEPSLQESKDSPITGGGADLESAWNPNRLPQELTIAPSTAEEPKDIEAEIKKLGLPDTVLKFSTGKTPFEALAGGGKQYAYQRPKIGKTEFKILVDNSPELQNNPVMIVDKEKNLIFEGEKFHFTIKPEALQISTKNLIPGDTIRIDTEKLKGTTQQMRIKSKKGEVLGFNPKNLENPFSPEAKAEVKKIVKQSEIAKALSEKLGVPIRRGKFRHGKAIGIYKPNAKVVRIKSGGLNTIFHEVAHYLDDTIGFSNDISIDERKKLMSEYGASYEGQPDKQKKEAFAEYLRFRMTGQTEKIKEWGPEFDKTFNEKIKQMPDVETVIDTATEDFARWNEQPSTQKILSQISIGGEAKTPFTDRVVQSMHDLYTSVLDDLHPLSEFSNIANKNIGKIDATRDPYVLARNLRGWVGKADLFLNTGTFGKQFWVEGPDGKIKMNFTGKSYSEIMKPVERAKALDDFRVYIVAQRIVNDLAPRKIKTGIDVKDAQKAIEELEAKHPDFSAIAAERRAFKDRLLEYAKDNGVIGEDGLKKMRELNKFHVPFYRVMESSGAKFLGKSKIAGNIANPIKKIKGSEREIIDPLESDVKDVYALVNAAERNNIGVAMANIAGQNFELGRLFEEVSKPMKPVKVNVKEVLDAALKNTDLEGMDIPEELASVVVNLFRTTHATGPNMLNVNMGDKQKVFEVDPDLFKAIQGLEVEDVGIVMKILSAPAKLLRAGATLSPDFSVRNPLRDQFTAFAYSKHGFIPGVDLVRGMFELFKKGDTYNLWKAGGGEHAMFVSLDRENLQENLKDVLSDPNLKDTVVDVLKNPIKVLQIISEIGEAGTRLGEMRNALARGVNPVEAAYASRNVTLDFSRIGTKTRAINAIVAFFNANIQGTDAMIRNFKERPFQTLWKVLLGITLPSVLLYLANRKDPRWKEIPQWQKDLFWIVMTPDHIYRIPKPFELGVIFGSVPERALEVMDSKDLEKFNELESTIANGFTPGFLPTALIPIIENITNYSFFLERPIVSPGKENLPPGEQAGPYTTEVSKLVGRALNYSPAKIDNLVSGYSGGLGKYAMSIMDKALVGTGIAKEPPQPATKFEDLPVIKAFMVREPVGSGSESVNRLYEMYSSSTQELNYVKKLVKQGQDKEALDYVNSHPDAINAIVLNQVVNTFSDLNKAIDIIRESENLSPQEKTDRIDKIQRAQTEIANQTLEKLKSQK